MTQGLTEPFITPAWPLRASISSDNAVAIRFVLPPLASAPSGGSTITPHVVHVPASYRVSGDDPPVERTPARDVDTATVQGLDGRPRTGTDPYARSRHNVRGGRIYLPAAPDGTFAATDYTVTLALAVSGSGTPPDVELLLDDVVIATLTPSGSGASWNYAHSDDHDLSAGGLLSLRFAGSGRRGGGQLTLTPA